MSCGVLLVNLGTPDAPTPRATRRYLAEFLADPRVVEYLSGREIAAATASDGWCCVTVDGFPLGGGKVSAGRVKNHYPKALRLL